MKRPTVILLYLLTLLCFCQSLFAQEIKGADMDFQRLSVYTYTINVSLYYLSDQEVEKPFVEIFFGDSTQDTAWLHTQQMIVNDIWKLSYSVDHTFPVDGEFTVGILDSIPLPELVNYSYEEGDIFRFYGPLYIPPTVISAGSPPLFMNDQTDVSLDDNGAWYHHIETSSTSGDTTLCFKSSLFTGMYPEFEFPMSSDSFHINVFACDVLWHKPVAPGKYLIPIVAQDFLIIEPDQYLPLTRVHRFMIVEIAEEDIVSSLQSTISLESNGLVISPNPVVNSFQINLSVEISEVADVKIYNSIGQLIFNKSKEFVTGKTRVEFFNNVIPGSYYISITLNGGLFNGKFTSY
ncbi:MAG: T9SS type A sorting domain-containing protein [Saprospiraceae bacterium]